MSSAIPSARPGRRRTSLLERLGTGTVGLGDMAAIVLLGTAACCGGLLALDVALVPRPAAPAAASPAATASPGARRFTGRDLGDYVGHWVSDAGARLIVSKSGAVWADGGALLGAATLDAVDRTRLLFAGTGFSCAYTVRAERPDALVWRVEAASPGAACPTGRYSRQFTF